ncbi:MAG: hypothetical protein HY874_00510 [Chloroflexi bacterium]|nr:hypothetical protein [Chloroflexota bacterium]
MREQGTQLEALIDAAVESGAMVITDSIAWRRGEGHLKARAEVDHPTEDSFRLELQYLPLISRFSIQLVFKGRPARRLCSDSPHTQALDCADAPGHRMEGTHKHRWSDETGDECVYVPDDIADSSDIEQSFYDFCSECNISFNGVWNEPPPYAAGFEVVG